MVLNLPLAARDLSLLSESFLLSDQVVAICTALTSIKTPAKKKA
jgi:hypothetical protein